MKNSEKTLDMIVNLCKSRGYVYAGSEIYGGLSRLTYIYKLRMLRFYGNQPYRKSKKMKVAHTFRLPTFRILHSLHA